MFQNALFSFFLMVEIQGRQVEVLCKSFILNHEIMIWSMLKKIEYVAEAYQFPCSSNFQNYETQLFV